MKREILECCLFSLTRGEMLKRSVFEWNLVRRSVLVGYLGSLTSITGLFRVSGTAGSCQLAVNVF